MASSGTCGSRIRESSRVAVAPFLPPVSGASALGMKGPPAVGSRSRSLRLGTALGAENQVPRNRCNANCSASLTRHCAGPNVVSRTTRTPSLGLALRDITNVVDSSRNVGPPASSPARNQPRASKRSSTSTGRKPRPSSGTIFYDGEDAAEYVDDMVDRLFEDEHLGQPKPDYMEEQPEVNGKMRAILLDWLVEIHRKYRLKPATLFLSANLMDRYMSHVKVPRSKLQLVGCAALLVAAKFEEVNPPSVVNLAYMTDNAFTADQIMELEVSFLSVLGFKIFVPVAPYFLDHFVRVNRCDEYHAECARYIMELGLLEVCMVRHAPSVLASAALLLSNELFGNGTLWPRALANATRHTQASIRGCVEELRTLLEGVPKMSLQSIRKKYMDQEHKGIARLIVGEF